MTVIFASELFEIKPHTAVCYVAPSIIIDVNFALNLTQVAKKNEEKLLLLHFLYLASVTGMATIKGRIHYSTSLKSLAVCLHQGQMKSAGSSSPS